jgi:uncharacterized protein
VAPLIFRRVIAMTAMDQSAQGSIKEPVTVIVSRVVKPGHEQEYEAWLREVTHAAMQFEGHLSVEIIRLADHRHPEYVLIFRFDSYDNLRKWETSDVRAEWVERARPLTQGEPTVEIVTGLEYWFTAPTAPSPPHYKQMTYVVMPYMTRLFAGRAKR